MKKEFSVLFYINGKSPFSWLERSLNSVLSNTVCPSEIIAVVFGPVGQEAKKRIAQAQARTRLQIFSYHAGCNRAEALQTAFSKCSHELVALQTVDAVSVPERFEKQLAYFEKYPQTAVVGGWCEETDKDLPVPIAIREVPEKEEEINVVLKRSTSLIGRSVMLKKSVVADVGAGRLFPTFDNAYLWTHLFAKNYPTANLKEVLVQARACACPEGLSWPCFRLKKDLFGQMRVLGMISRFTYYRLVSSYFIRCMLPDYLHCFLHRERLIADEGPRI